MTFVVMDTSVLIACLLREQGYMEAESFLPHTLVSTVNMAEVATRFARHGFTENEVREMMKTLPVHTEVFGDDLATLTGLLIQETRQFGLSLGDRACLALGMMRKLPVLTADRIWGKLNLPIEIRLIR